VKEKPMQLVNEAIRRKLEKYPSPVQKLALQAIMLAEKHGSDASVAEQLKQVVRQLVRDKK
jgi:hypothetical protein